jgi:hypothetical protein
MDTAEEGYVGGLSLCHVLMMFSGGETCDGAMISHLFLFLFLLFRSALLCSDVLDLLHQSTPSRLAPLYLFDHTQLT